MKQKTKELMVTKETHSWQEEKPLVARETLVTKEKPIVARVINPLLLG